MHRSIAAVGALFDRNTTLYEKALDGLDRDALLQRPGDRSNPILWIAGHLASVRYGLCGLVGRRKETPWGRLFYRGALLSDPASLPPVAEILGGWRDASGILMPRLEELTETELEAPSPRPFPISDSSVRGAITFLAFHEGYHTGQIGYLRKWLGFPSLLEGN